MTEDKAKRIQKTVKNKHQMPGRMSIKIIRGQISKIEKDLASKELKFTGPQRYKLYMRVEALQGELKAIELEKLESEAMLESVQA